MFDWVSGGTEAFLNHEGSFFAKAKTVKFIRINSHTKKFTNRVILWILGAKKF